MKYLELYKTFESVKTFFEVDDVNFGNKHRDNFTKKEIDLVSNVLESDVDISNSSIIDFRGKLLIVKNKDEWYYVIFSERGLSYGSNIAYRCDQLDGLSNCLRYLKSEYPTI